MEGTCTVKFNWAHALCSSLISVISCISHGKSLFVCQGVSFSPDTAVQLQTPTELRMQCWIWISYVVSCLIHSSAFRANQRSDGSVQLIPRCWVALGFYFNSSFCRNTFRVSQQCKTPPLQHSFEFSLKLSTWSEKLGFSLSGGCISLKWQWVTTD